MSHDRRPPTDTTARALPADHAAEAHVLGCVLRDEALAARVFPVLTTESFDLPKHRLIYEAMQELSRGGEKIDRTAVASVLIRRGDLGRAGGHSYLVEIIDDALESTLTDTHISTVHDCYRRRTGIRLCRETAGRWHEEAFEPVLADLETQIFRFHKTGRQRWFTSSEVADSTAQLIDDYRTGLIDRKLIRLGYADIDKHLETMRGDWIVVGGRTSMGKTGLVLNMIERAALKSVNPRGCMIFTVEMAKERLYMRMACSRAGVSKKRMREGKLTPDDQRRLDAALVSLHQAPIYVDDSGYLTPQDVLGKVREAKSKHPEIDIVVIDHFHLMSPDAGIRWGNENEKYGAISNRMKELAKETQTVIVTPAQLNREADKRQDRRPVLSDLRSSGAIEQDADVVLMLYRPEYYLRHNPDAAALVAGNVEVWCEKNRNGEVGWKCDLTFNGDTARFADKEAAWQSRDM